MNYPKPNHNRPTHPPLRYLSPLHRAVRAVQEHFRRQGGRHGVPPRLAHIVSYLASYGPVPVGKLIEVFGLGKSTLTGSLDRLEERGLVAREVNPDDRRSFLVDLTTAGRREAAGVRTMLEEFEHALDGELSAADCKAFARVMDAIARITAPDPGNQT